MSFSLPSSETLHLTTPPGFDFWRTVFSHGWCSLPPFAYDPDEKTLSRVVMVEGAQTVLCDLKENRGSIHLRVESARPLAAAGRRELVQQMRTCLRLDEDFREFHREARRHLEYRWIASHGAGRMLRAPTVFEDAVKMICTTNCTWQLTTLMVSNLVRHFGMRHSATHWAFPSPAVLARSTEAVLRKEIKAGYRAPYLLELAGRVASGTLDLESWRSSPLSTPDLFKEMRSVKGIGPYAAGNLLKLVGRYDYLGLDSWVRAKYAELHRRGRKVKDATIERDYNRYGRWRGLFFWFEMTRSWHDDKFRL